MSISRVQLFSIPVSDQDRARSFYLDTLGFELVAEAQMATTSLTLVTWFPSMAPGSLKGTVLETDSLERMITTLREKGVTIGEIETAPWGRFETFDDPHGIEIVLQETSA
jgi:catechol 2,3-dioxygenase-like lactoylglutathione lyase family enzyme